MRYPLRLPTVTLLAGFALFAGSLPGCSGPLDAQRETLRRSIVESSRREIADAQRDPDSRTLSREPTELRFSDIIREELRQMAGPESYHGAPVDLGPDLLGEETRVVSLTLREAIVRAVEQNLQVQLARFTPAISEAQLVAADAAFDWTLFANANFSRTDQPNPIPVINNVPVGSAVNKRKSTGFQTGVRTRLDAGGTLEVSTSLNVVNNQASNIELFPDPSRATTLDIILGQPLLRGFGADVALAEIQLASNLERDSIQLLKATLIDTVTNAERAYWNLHLARARLLIQQRLLERGVETRDVLKGRLDFDVKPAEYSDAVARVEARRANVIRAVNTLRQSSDQLKAIINDPEMTVGSEVVLLPLDDPIDAPAAYSLLDALTAAIAARPEIQRSILAIDDASIRQTVAQNAHLPILDLTFQATFNGLDDNVSDAYSDIGEAQFVDILLGLFFEQPIGNRGANAQSRAARLQRAQSVVAYRATVQQVVLEVKTALRDLVTNYQLIEQTRVSRLASAENLRTLLVEEENTRALTPDFLDLKLRRQESLALAELEEALALVDYNTALANLHDAMGVALERNQIRFVVPDPVDESANWIDWDRAQTDPFNTPDDRDDNPG